MALLASPPAFSECGFDASASAAVDEASDVPRALPAALSMEDDTADDCLIEATALLENGGVREGVQLVDLRGAADASVRIPGALRLPAKSLGYGSFLSADQRIALLAEPHATADLRVSCQRLREQGFDTVHGVRGGIRGWHAAGGPLTGDETSLDRPDIVDAAGAAVLLQQENVIVLVDGSLPAPARAHVMGIRTRPDRVVASGGSGAPDAVLAIVAPSEVARHVRRFRAAKRPEPVYFTEGMAVLAAHVEQQQRIALAASTPLQRSCPWN